jgi:hypothetical protein
VEVVKNNMPAIIITGIAKTITLIIAPFLLRYN